MEVAQYADEEVEQRAQEDRVAHHGGDAASGGRVQLRVRAHLVRGRGRGRFRGRVRGRVRARARVLSDAAVLTPIPYPYPHPYPDP